MVARLADPRGTLANVGGLSEGSMMARFRVSVSGRQCRLIGGRALIREKQDKQEKRSV